MRPSFTTFSIVNIFTVLVILLFTQSGYSKNLDTIAILPFSGQGVEENELYLFETALRNEIDKSDNFKAFESARMMQLFENSGILKTRTCNEIACAILMGEMLSINFVTQCRIGRIENSYTINLRIIDVKNREVIEDIAEYYNGSIYDLLKKTVPKIAQIIVRTKLSDRKFIINGKKEKYIERTESNQQPQSPQNDIPVKNDSKQADKRNDDDYIYIEWDRDEHRDEYDEYKDKGISENKPKEITDPAKTPGTLETSGMVDVPKRVDAPKKVNTPKIVDIPKKVDAPRIVDVPKKVDAPRIVDVPKKVDAPRIVDVPKKVDAPKIVDVPRKVDAPRMEDTPRIVDAPRKVDAPRMEDTPRKVDAPRMEDAPRIVDAPRKVDALEVEHGWEVVDDQNKADILNTEEISEIAVISKNDISSSSKKAIHQVVEKMEMDSRIIDQKQRTKLRYIPKNNLKPEEIKKMILDNDFFCNNSDVSVRWSNPDSKYSTNHLVVLTGDKILIDSTTQLMWQSEGSLKRLSYTEINQYVLDINNSYFGGYNNWRLPTLEEAMSIVNSKKNNGLYISDKFSGTQNSIWTADKVSVDYSMIVRFDKGQCNYGSTQHYPRFVRLVRSF